jgi:hypothetical protein
MTDPIRRSTQSSTSTPPQAGAGRPSRLSLGGGSDVGVQTSAQQIGPEMSGGDGAGLIGQQRPAEVGDGGAAPAGQKNWFSRTRDRLRGRKVPRWTGKGAAIGLGATGTAGGIATAIAVAAGKGAAIGGTAGLGFFGVGALGGALIGGAIGAVGAIVIGGLIGYAKAGGRGRDKAEQMIDSLQDERMVTAQQAGKLKGLSTDQLSTLYQIEDGELNIEDRNDRQAMRNAIRKTLLLTTAKYGYEEATELRARLLEDDGGVQRCYQLIDPDAPPQALSARRDEVEEAIDRLEREGLITATHASDLNGLDDDELRALDRIPPGLNLPDEDQEPFRQLMLLTAAKDGQQEVQSLRDEVQKYASSGKSGTVARNLLAVRTRLASDRTWERPDDEKQDRSSEQLDDEKQDWTWQQLDDEKQEELLRYMHDEAMGLARLGISMGQDSADRLFRQARERVGQLNSLYLGEISRCRYQAVEVMGRLLDELGRGQLSSEGAVHGLLEANDLLSEMQGYEQENSQEQRIRTHVDNVAGDAIVRNGANANHLLGAALAPGRALRTAVQGAQAYSEQAATEAERYLALRVVEGAQRLVRLLGEIGGPAAGSLEADQSTLMGAAADRDQARDRFARWIVPELVSRLTVGSILNSQNAVLKSQFARWAAQTGRDTRFETVHEINRALAVTGPEFDTRFGTVSNKLPDVRGIPPKTRRALQYAAAHGDEAEKKELLRQVRDGLVPIRRFRDWYANQGRGDGTDT